MSKRDPFINIVVGMRGVGKTYANAKMMILDTNGEIDANLPMEEVNENGVPVEKSILKYVFCNYGGQLTVEDVHGNRVGELCGEMTLEKYREIERRTNPSITEFEGLEQYRCIVCKLKEKEERIMNGEEDPEIDDKDWDNQHDPFAKPVKANNYTPPRPQPITPNNSPNYNAPTIKPTNPLVGEFFIDTTTGIPNVWDGNKWIEIMGGGGILSGSQVAPQVDPNAISQAQIQAQQRVNTPTGIPIGLTAKKLSYQKGYYKAVANVFQTNSDIMLVDNRTGQNTTFCVPFAVDQNWLEELIDKEFDK